MAGSMWDLAHPSAPVGRDSDIGRAVEAVAVSVERWPVDRLVACAAGPGGVPAAVTEAGLMADENGAGAEGVSVCYLARPWLTCRFLRSSVRSCQLCRRQTAAV